MRSINPAIKFISLLAVTFFLAYRFDPVLNFAVFLISVAAMLLSGVRLKKLCLYMIPVLIVAVGMFFTGYRFSADHSMPVTTADFLISDSRWWNGLAQAGRVLAYAGLGYLFALTTDRIFLIRSFKDQFHLPQIFVYGLLAAWGIVPHMMQEYKRTKAAFRARGLSVVPVSPALLKPLLVKSVRWSEELAIAMESKGFSGHEKRTDYAPVHIQIKDILFLIVCAAFLFAVALLR